MKTRKNFRFNSIDSKEYAKFDKNRTFVTYFQAYLIFVYVSFSINVLTFPLYVVNSLVLLIDLS